MTKRIIWSNKEINLDDWKEYLNEEYPDVTDEYEQYRLICDINYECFDDERMNLDQELEGRVIVIADLGLWAGRTPAYKILGSNVNEIFNCGVNGDSIEWYADGYNIRGTEGHHDGQNYYEFRMIREDRNIENLLDAIYNRDEISRRKINYYTKSLYPYVAKAYGW